MTDLRLDFSELTENPTARLPICLVLDVSASMYGDKIDELNRAVRRFFDEVRADEFTLDAADISIVTFGRKVQQVMDFASVDRQSVPLLTPEGTTPMGQAVNLALDVLEGRKKMYQSVGVDYFQPWMVLMSDGAPTDSIDHATHRCCALESQKKLSVFSVGIGHQASLQSLSQFTNRSAFKLKGLNFTEFFEWLSQSMSATSRSIPGDEMDVMPQDLSKWAEL